MTDLTHGEDFFEYWRGLDVSSTGATLQVGPHAVMYTWERDLMRRYAEVVAEEGGDVLEVGYGMGCAAEAIQELGVRSHTILEPHPTLYENARRWARACSGRVSVIDDFWQRRLESLDRYDAILFDSYSLPEHQERDCRTFFEAAARRLLRPGGRLAWFWFGGDVVPETYQRALLDSFRRLELRPYALPREARGEVEIERLVIPVAYA